jgi:hypothetical protein
MTGHLTARRSKPDGEALSATNVLISRDDPVTREQDDRQIIAIDLKLS